MPKPRLTLPQHEVIDALAHAFIAADMDKSVAGLQGFMAHYEKKVMTPKQKLIWEAFKARVPAIRKDMRRLLEADMAAEEKT